MNKYRKLKITLIIVLSVVVILIALGVFLWPFIAAHIDSLICGGGYDLGKGAI